MLGSTEMQQVALSPLGVPMLMVLFYSLCDALSVNTCLYGALRQILTVVAMGFPFHPHKCFDSVSCMTQSRSWLNAQLSI